MAEAFLADRQPLVERLSTRQSLVEQVAQTCFVGVLFAKRVSIFEAISALSMIAFHTFSLFFSFSLLPETR